jgi:hypothetical protein
MTDRRGSRFVLEVLFLLALAVALTLANLRPLEIAGIMLIGWVIVALLEWVAWREEPHYGSGLPPRYYVPQVNLPPAQPLEPVATGDPEARDEAPTWIASPAVRAEMLGTELRNTELRNTELRNTEPLGDWPVAAPPVSPPPEEQEPEADSDPWTRPEELPVAPLGELDPQPEPESEPEPEPVAAAEAAPTLIPPPVSAPAASVAGEETPEPEPEPETEPEPSLDVELTRSAQSVARYSLDPLGDPAPRRRFGRGGAPEPDAVEVPARPEGVRALPGRTKRQD